MRFKQYLRNREELQWEVSSVVPELVGEMRDKRVFQVDLEYPGDPIKNCDWSPYSDIAELNVGNYRAAVGDSPLDMSA
jgi:hypothetical protein